MFRGKLLVLLLAGTLLAACTGGPAEEGGPPSSVPPTTVPERPPEEFYAVPDPLPPGPPGALIRALPIAALPVLPDSRAWAILYHPATSTAATSRCRGW